jgi:hypothetical protein
VNNDDERPYGTSLFHSITSSRVLNLKTYNIGAKISVFTISAS